MKKSTTSGLSPERLARLLGIALGSDSGEGRNNSAKTTAELLEARLEGILPLDTAIVDELPTALGQLHKNLVPCLGSTLGDVLTDPKSDLEKTKRVRRWAKRMASRRGSEAEHAVAVAIYFAAIANALIFRDVKITTHSYESLEASFRKLAEKHWMPAQLVRIFTKAHKVCRRKR